jgi:N-methylhydantoinase B/oxoprolinase/acetone carboxylase alpha subunit
MMIWFQEQLVMYNGKWRVINAVYPNGNAYSGKYPAESYFKQVMVEQVQQESIYDATNVSLRGFC